MKRMPDKDPGFWAGLLAWLYAHKNESGYAAIAGVMALLRASYLGVVSWPKRILDAAMCSMFAFFLQPTLRVVGSIFNWDISPDTAWIFAIFIGALGFDYLREKLGHQINRRLGDDNADTH